MEVNEIIDIGYKKFSEFSDGINDIKPLIVITGGEPMRQNISLLCKTLLDNGHIVQIESNGTLISPDLPKDVKIVCSPKIANNKYYKVRSDVLNQTIAIKFIVSESQTEYSDIGDVGQKEWNIPVYIQPMDEYNSEKNFINLSLAMKLAVSNNGILSLQTHKMIGIE